MAKKLLDQMSNAIRVIKDRRIWNLSSFQMRRLLIYQDQILVAHEAGFPLQNSLGLQNCPVAFAQVEN